MVNLKTTRSAWIDAAVALLTDEGVEAVGAEALARRLGVSKGGFYGYFGDRARFLAELLSTWEHAATDGIVTRVGVDGDPRERVRELARALRSEEPSILSVQTEVAIRDWARRDPGVQAAVQRVQVAQAAFLHALFRQYCTEREARYRTVVAMSVRLSTHFLPDEESVDLVVAELLR
ncbi:MULTISPECIES: TetR/AcrR family transcriptional regulator [Microbacterium]|uniref:TetR/AcrR family transcriptional regulator n=1 Tax=Microbacterium wangchenii TaxID=2541726 RepID=A0ABX5SS23_9MICO|nr:MULTISPECIES: TetR/AcrR family transcriptional regulator [Microbacterium]MCK6065510.1 TetR/AcrR family transcriptional regulator [Microbacterium sp. EYE_512]QBR88936.1 TetR/AcrR family transcriptional regulator [Microbacterium wangchenii]TFV81993.1 TetR/AcrR family transcriptional regulator [Microbacterium sp. dk485]TXK20656.1 TetR/AcrR family transcriptional regulator [Microbacterium wangchenii]